MGLISRVLGNSAATSAIGSAAVNVAEVFVPNATKKMEAAHDAYRAALDEHGAEFQYAAPGWFDRLVNGLNRLPRPMLALGTLGLFAHAMVDPVSFAERMVGLGYVPEPLWWLLGAVVSFYFGAREAHYFRTRPVLAQPAGPVAGPAAPVEENAALSEWRAGQGSVRGG
ncbi:methionine synthase I [Rhodobacter veldkampii DSM 11550]|uniref:Methionine synthase I n=1 Tax=Phaeovulum veldkampii DSM 11550 TaxID=1185920 RepID=A0A2T4JMS7_9RHOB|nr:holin family protein [Phaeovulum veldkampii]MBK5946290.1 methionine synthase I [Phaeovulum veldkampii DSM 11550]NCU19526.1 methionine synthase I [Candidatus Falkowbacteria bacterium]PTE19067.1 methionine synthase I [Phaeovulum veldkampii DSM 11550]TDQ61382.1 holin (3TMs family) [Phaeovulum veldkampii DSM 11550]